MRPTGLLVALMLLLGGCDNDEPAAVEEPETPEASSTVAPGECFEPSLASLEVLGRGITAEGAVLAMTAVAAEDSDGLFYVGGELEGADFEGPGDFALWATTEDPAGEALDFAAVNALAIEESDWEPDADIPEDDPAIDELTDCIDELLEERGDV